MFLVLPLGGYFLCCHGGCYAYDDAPHSDPKNHENNGFHEIIMFGISPTTTEDVIARSARFRRERLAICNCPRDQWRTSAASSNATSKHTHVLQNTMDARGRCKKLSSSLRSFELHKPSVHSRHLARHPALSWATFRTGLSDTCTIAANENYRRHQIIGSAQGNLSSMANVIRKMTVKCVTMDDDIICPSNVWQLLAKCPWPEHHEGTGWHKLAPISINSPYLSGLMLNVGNYRQASGQRDGFGEVRTTFPASSIRTLAASRRCTDMPQRQPRCLPRTRGARSAPPLARQSGIPCKPETESRNAFPTRNTSVSVIPQVAEPTR